MGVGTWEALEAKRKAEEEAAREEEETRIREEEEERRRIEEEERKKVDAERRKAEKAARREQLKREGKLLTGKAKAEAERLARAREQLLKQAGIDPAERKLLLIIEYNFISYSIWYSNVCWLLKKAFSGGIIWPIE